jgi:hypothetical protein
MQIRQPPEPVSLLIACGLRDCVRVEIRKGRERAQDNGGTGDRIHADVSRQG